MRYRYKMKSDNRGASMVTVLIAITFISILGAILLFTAYTGYRIKVAGAVGEDRFYDAETAMEEVRAGLQNMVSSSIAIAYTEAMTTYDGVRDIDSYFMETFKNTFLNITDLFILPGPVDTMFGVPPDGSYTGGARFEPDTLEEFISDRVRAELSLPGGDPDVDIRGKWTIVDGENIFQVASITLKGLRVTHISDDDYLSIVDSDLTVAMPNLAYTRSMFSFRDVVNYAFIATDELTTGGTVDSPEINGSAYVGSVSLTSAGGDLYINRGTFISGGIITAGEGNIKIANQKLFVAPTVSLWANNIILGQTAGAGIVDSPGSAAIEGNTYVANDLIFRGSGSEAVLKGRYFGFGYGNDLFDTGDINSSIIVNSRHNTLDMSELRQLHLAGQTFIDLANPAGEEIFTGQSIAVRSDQLAYLLPHGHVEILDPNNEYGFQSNPYVEIPYYDNDEDSPTYDQIVYEGIPDYTINYDAPLWGTTKTLRDYVDPSAPGGGVHTYYTQPLGASGARLFYIFIKFDDFTNSDGELVTKQQAAANYFRDYFQYNTEDISNYMGIYLDLYKSATTSVFSRGITYDGEFDPSGSPDTIGVVTNPNSSLAPSFEVYYDNLRRTLTRTLVTGAAVPPENPFEYIVTGDAAGNPPPPGNYEYDGKIVTYVHGTGGALSLSLLNSMGVPLDDLTLLISYSDVYVDEEFRGLILCQGNIRIQADVYPADGVRLSDAIKATNSADEMISDYLIFTPDADAEGSGSAWDFAEIVHFSNWKKS